MHSLIVSLSVFVLVIAVSAIYVRKSINRNIDKQITYLQSLKIVMVRLLAAVFIGFMLGKIVALGMQVNIIDLSTISEFRFLIPLILAICFVGSFIAYKWVAQRVAGQEISLRKVINAYFHEMRSNLKLMLILFFSFVIILSVVKYIDVYLN